MEENNHKTVFLVLGIILLIILVYFFVFYNKSDQPVGEIDVSLNKVDVSAALTDEDKLPQGFSKDIPVELSNITESYSTEYKDAGFTQSSLSYTSDRTVEDLYKEYEAYMTSDGYDIYDSELSDDYASIDGSKGEIELSVVVDGLGETRVVSVSYVE